jgi:hypothetical protein
VVVAGRESPYDGRAENREARAANGVSQPLSCERSATDAMSYDFMIAPPLLPVIRRASVRVMVLDGRGRLLLLNTRDPARPWFEWWELPGGGIEQGETPHDAALRELYEEPESLPTTLAFL